jgi:hypothetical protein
MGLGRFVGQAAMVAPPGTRVEGLPATERSSGAGLLRARTATNAEYLMQGKLGDVKSGPRGGFIASTIGKMFPNLAPLPPRSGITYREDENARFLMLTTNRLFPEQGGRKFTQAFTGISDSAEGVGGISSPYVGKYNSVTIVGQSPIKVSSPSDPSNYKQTVDKEEWSKNAENSFLAKVYDTWKTDEYQKSNNDLVSGVNGYADERNSLTTHTKKAFSDTQKSIAQLDTFSSRIKKVSTTDPNGPLKEYLSTVKSPKRTNELGFADIGRKDTVNLSQVGDKNYTIKDDFIPFYFYDVVNEKYIQFRATLKSLSDNNSSEWDAVSYIGRADKIYNYKGFTNTISFDFKVYATHPDELLYMWQRLSYLKGLTRPSKYVSDLFMTPPFVKLTIGDLYIMQPSVLDSVNFSFPDEETSWELSVSDFNSGGYDYRGYNLPSSQVARLPMSVNVNISAKLLEKEVPVTGYAGFMNSVGGIGGTQSTVEKLSDDVIRVSKKIK